MRKKYIYGLLACFGMMMLPGCNENYEDATSMHVYGPNENPPVKADPKVTASRVYEMTGGQTDPVAIDIYEYDDMIRKAFGISAQELAGKIGNEYVVAPINPNRMIWLKNAPNTGDKYGWYISKTGNICEKDDSNIYGKVIYNEGTHSLEFYIDPNGGGSVPVQIGFAKDGPNYNEHVRFVFNVTAYDKSYAFLDVSIPPGDYAAYTLPIEDLAENINFVFGMTPAQFISAMMNDQIGIYMIDHATNGYIWDGVSTANGGGYWCNAEGGIQSWGDGCAYYIEPWIEDEEPCFAIGRYPGIDPGTVHSIKFGLADKNDHAKALSVFCTATYE